MLPDDQTAAAPDESENSAVGPANDETAVIAASDAVTQLSQDDATWIWGRPRDAVIVMVWGTTDYASIVIRRSTNADMYCHG